MFRSTEPPFDIDLLLREFAKRQPDVTAIKIGHETLSWSEFHQEINRGANALLARGLKPGMHVAALGRNSLSYIILVFVCFRTGACIAPLQTLASEDDLLGMINDSKAQFLFVSSEFIEATHNRFDELKHVPKSNIFSLDLSCQHFTTFDDIRQIEKDSFNALELSADTNACLVYSSGTTGVPKGILQSRSHKAHECRDMIEAKLDTLSRTIISTPLCSSTTLFVLLSTLGNGGTVTVMPKFNAEDFLRICEEDHITHAILVPVQYERLINVQGFEHYDLSSFKVKVSIGAPLRQSLKADILKKWPDGGLWEFYGMTEGGPSCVLPAHEYPNKLDTVGRPGENCILKIISEDGVVLPIGEIGEVVGWSERMMLGYWGQEEETEKASWYDDAGKKYFKSGDIGWLDEDGFLHLVDRKKDMIISGGYNVYAADLEGVLYKNPIVSEAAVVGVSSKIWGETPVAFVVPKNKHVHVTAPLELKAWANDRLGKVQHVSNIYFIDELPRNETGKVLKKELRATAPLQP